VELSKGSPGARSERGEMVEGQGAVRAVGLGDGWKGGGRG
jgi:hypothetical protein